MKQLVKLTVIGIVAGIVLAGFLKVVLLFTGSTGYVLLFNVDYVPLLKRLDPVVAVQLFFHFGTCIISVIALYYLLLLINREKNILNYVLVIMAGSGMLFFLTAFSEKTPSVTDGAAFTYWIIGHGLFGLVTGWSIRKFL